MRSILIFPILIYKKFVSPVATVYLGYSCRYSPTCSQYAIDAINKYGVNGIKLAIKRVLRCNWKSTKYWDPV